MMETTTSITRNKYNRNSGLYDLFEFPAEILLYGRWRKQLFSNIGNQKFLEVGVGTGKNFNYHPAGSMAIGVDLSEGMLRKAKLKSKQKTKILIQTDIQHLPFADATFDQVVATFVFCSVPDPVVGLREIRRILKPDGKLYLLEHVLPENKILAKLFNAFNFITVKRGGFFINRRTAENVKAAGFRIVKENNLLSTVFKSFIFEPG
ncbi:demethylmenaquinone methyltransferase [bacterium BMS3Abin03]|nr:demethylmenaquinone methyltransferase [bacterium BMS3Abin03]